MGVVDGNQPMPTGLKRDLGLVDTAAIAIGAMIGSGIFILPGIDYVFAGPAAVLAFAVAGCRSGTAASLDGCCGTRRVTRDRRGPRVRRGRRDRGRDTRRRRLRSGEAPARRRDRRGDRGHDQPPPGDPRVRAAQPPRGRRTVPRGAHLGLYGAGDDHGFETDDPIPSLARFVGEADLLLTGVGRAGVLTSVRGDPGQRLVEAVDCTAVMVQTHEDRQRGPLERAVLDYLFS